MSPELKWQIIAFVVPIIFSAGMLAAFVKIQRSQLNGIGNLARSIRDEHRRDFLLMVVVLMLLTPEDKRQQIAEMIQKK